MNRSLLTWWTPLVVGIGIFGWLMTGGPAAPSAKAGPVAALLDFFPFISRDFNFRLAPVNAYRTQAGLPVLTEDPDWSLGAALHAQYMVKTDQLVGTEDKIAFPQWYTDDGNYAASRSLLMVTETATIEDKTLVDYWMRSPFQALSILDPELQRAGFGTYHEADGGLQSAAALNVVSGWLAGAPASLTFPVVWPGRGTTVGLRSYSGNDVPDPRLAPNCASALGLPLLVQFGDGSLAGERLAPTNPTSIMSVGGPVAHCAFSATEYPANPADGNYGKLLLDTRDAVVLLPQDPLMPGATYTVNVAALVNTTPLTVTWSFTITPDAAP